MYKDLKELPENHESKRKMYELALKIADGDEDAINVEGDDRISICQESDRQESSCPPFTDNFICSIQTKPFDRHNIKPLKESVWNDFLTLKKATGQNYLKKVKQIHFDDGCLYAENRAMMKVIKNKDGFAISMEALNVLIKLKTKDNEIEFDSDNDFHIKSGQFYVMVENLTKKFKTVREIADTQGAAFNLTSMDFNIDYLLDALEAHKHATEKRVSVKFGPKSIFFQSDNNFDLIMKMTEVKK